MSQSVSESVCCWVVDMFLVIIPLTMSGRHLPEQLEQNGCQSDKQIFHVWSRTSALKFKAMYSAGFPNSCRKSPSDV